MTKKSEIEIRLNVDGSLDEIVTEKCTFHLEQMSPTHWWMAVSVGEEEVAINLESEAKITAIVEKNP